MRPLITPRGPLAETSIIPGEVTARLPPTARLRRYSSFWMSFATCVTLPPLSVMSPDTVKRVKVAPGTSGYIVAIVTVPE